MGWVGLAMIAISVLQVPQQPSATSDDNPRTFVVTYSDGRIVSSLLRPRGGSITPRFPQRPDAPTNEGLTLSGLQIDYVVNGDVIVTVSLRYGPVYQKTVRVTVVRLAGAEPVTVQALEAFGVDPIILSLGDFASRPLVQPTVSSVSSSLDVSIELTQPDLPIYRVTLHNRSATSVMALDFRTFLGDTPKLSGRKKARDYKPVIAGGSDYEFILQVGSGSSPGIDRLEVHAVLWQNGVLDGDAWLQLSEEAHCLGQAQQLERVLRLLQEPREVQVQAIPKDLSSVKAAVEALPVTFDSVSAWWASTIGKERHQWVESGQQMVRATVLRDIEEFSKKTPATAEHIQSWIVATRTQYQAWLKRLQNMWEAARNDR